MIRVGIVGASPDRGWASRAHVPALRAQTGFRLTAVGTSRAESAQRAACEFGADHWFTDARALAEHPDVDLVTITVKVPAHVELVTAALDAGKHVYCEWPLTATTAEADALVKAADQAGVHHAVGLQARFSPALTYARDLLADGYVGRVTSATLYAARKKGFGGALPAGTVYTLDANNGAGLLEVYGGHTLDALEFLLGDIADLTAVTSIQHPRYTVLGTGETVEVTSPDHLALNAHLTSGAVASVHLHEAKAGDPRVHLEITGTERDLAVVSTGATNPNAIQIQIGELGVRGTDASGSWQVLQVPDRYVIVPGVAPEARNVAQLYARLAEEIRTGERRVPTFGTGADVHRLLDAIRISAETGSRQQRGGR